MLTSPRALLLDFETLFYATAISFGFLLMSSTNDSNTHYFLCRFAVYPLLTSSQPHYWPRISLKWKQLKVVKDYILFDNIFSNNEFFDSRSPEYQKCD